MLTSIKQRVRSSIRPEPILLFFILVSNTAIVADWYFTRPEQVRGDEAAAPLRKSTFKARLDKMILTDNDQVEFHGWAFDAGNFRLPDEILLSYDGEPIYSGQPNLRRPDIARLYGDKALDCGFSFVIPRTLFKDKKIDNLKIRLFAVSNGVASELNYPGGFK